MDSFDYIVVGAGSAGCVLANRLSADPDNDVLLLEAGGSDRSLFIRMPAAFSIPMNMKKYNWGFKTLPEAHLDGRRLDCPRGRGLGGSSSINGMVFVRGHACDFEQWKTEGADGWGFENCLPYFRRMETWLHGENEYRGGGGPLAVCEGNRMQNPLYRAFIEAGREAGYPVTEDYNAYQQEGFAPYQMTVRNGERCSAADAYLHAAAGRPNLEIARNALVEYVTLEGRKASGVSHSGGRLATARRAVILCAGAIGSPVLLQRSGIGPVDVLEEAGIEVVHELPGVGENLQDHLEVYFQYRCKQPLTLNAKLDWFSRLAIGSRWLISRSGLGATNHFESGAFIRSRAGIRWPDIQYHFLPGAIRYDGRSAFAGHGYQVHVGPNKPGSRGSVRIRARSGDVPPDIRFNYLSTEQDRADWRICLKLTREIMQQPAFDPYRGDEIQPAINLDDDDAVDNWVRQNVESAYHPSCSCKMGAERDPLAVLTADCRVRGIDNLRVVDASIFPTITNGNLNAPTIMAAEKAADMILGRAPLTERAPYWIDEQWQDRQRSLDKGSESCGIRLESRNP